MSVCINLSINILQCFNLSWSIYSIYPSIYLFHGCSWVLNWCNNTVGWRLFYLFIAPLIYESFTRASPFRRLVKNIEQNPRIMFSNYKSYTTKLQLERLRLHGHVNAKKGQKRQFWNQMTVFEFKYLHVATEKPNFWGCVLLDRHNFLHGKSLRIGGGKSWGRDISRGAARLAQGGAHLGKAPHRWRWH